VNVPPVAARLVDAWGLELGEPFDLTLNWVAPARRDGEEVVLKVGLTRDGHLAREAAALGAWAGRGAVRLLRADLDRQALLLERALPGTPVARLVRYDDEAATGAAVGVLRRLHAAPVPPGVLPLAERIGAFDEHLAHAGHDRFVPRPLVERAREVARELLADRRPAVLLHGDLHHGNVLRAEREDWLAVDPHGVAGEAAYDAGAWLYNPLPDPKRAVPALVPRRVEQLADGLGAPVERVVGWGFVQAVLSAVWTASDGARPHDRTLDVAALLLPRLA